MCAVAGFGHGKGMAALAHLIFVNGITVVMYYRSHMILHAELWPLSV